MTYPLTLKAKAHTGAMVALFLDPELAAELAIPGGESPEDLHITLAYLGEASEIKNKEYLQNVVMQLGQSLGTLHGRLNGLARFNTGKEGDKVPYVILPDLPDLPEFRQMVTSSIREAGYYVARNHGYIPHITIAYQDDGEPWPADNVGEREIGFSTISLCIGGERYDYPLSGRYPFLAAKSEVSNGDSETSVVGLISPDIIKAFVERGGPTSGNYAHKGRPGKHGGSVSGGGHGKLGIKGKPTKRKINNAKKRASKPSAKKQAANKISPSDIVKNGPKNPTDFRSYLLKELHGKKTITMEQAEEADKLFKANRKAAKKKQSQRKSDSQKAPDLSKESSGVLRRTLELLKESFNKSIGQSKKDFAAAISNVESELETRKADFDSETSVVGLISPDIIKSFIERGGPTSGNWGHVGRPGKHGGSLSGGGHKALPFSGKPTRGKIKAASKKIRKQRTEKRAFEKAKETLLSGRGLENLSRAELMTLSSRLDSMLGKSSTENTKLAKEKPDIKKGAATIALGATPDKRYNMQYEVVELSDLVTSNTQGGGINPAYPKELQPRDRTRAASRAQISKIASNLEPDALLGEFSSIDRGTPILGTDDNAVESGNGRTMALQRAKDSHPDQWNKYQNRLRETAQDRGIDPATLDGYENPVLIRRRTDSSVDRVQFAKDANTAQILGESASERARNDASRITSESLQNIDVRGDINATITAPTNRAFVRNFVANTPETERAALMTSDGSLTKVGRDRIKGAMFNRVYDAPELSDKIFEALDDDTKNVTNGLMNSLGSMSKAQELVRTGQRAKDLDIAPDIIAAVSTFDRLKSSGQSIDNFLAQGSMFGSPVDKNQEKILREIDKRRRSGKKMQDFFEAWPKLVEKEPHPQQQGLFGGNGRSKSQLVDDWITAANRSDQQSLFSMKSDFATSVTGLVSVESIKRIRWL